MPSNYKEKYGSRKDLQTGSDAPKALLTFTPESTKGGARREGPGECLDFKEVLSFPNDNTRSQLSISPLTI